mgnify:FL=1
MVVKVMAGIIPAYRTAMDCKKRILVVEDNLGSRQLLALVLSRSGYEITEAATGLEAVDRARATRPHLIIMDLGLPGITGDEATARLKADAMTRDIPVVVNTAFHRESSRVPRAMAPGAAEILYKPTSLKVFEDVARRYLSSAASVTASFATANH